MNIVLSDPEFGLVTDAGTILTTTFPTKGKEYQQKNFGPDTYSDSECSILSDPECGTLNDAGTIPKTAIEKEYQWEKF